MSRIVVIDKDKGTRTVLGGLLNSDGYDVHIMSDGEDILSSLDSESCDVVVSAQDMEPVSGMDVLGHMHENHPSVPVILLTASPSMDQATQALKLGVFDYITKPFKVDTMTTVIDHAISHRKNHTVGADFREILGAAYRLHNMIAASPEMNKVCDNIERMAPLDMPVLIEGPKGSGRSYAAAELHAVSPRRDKAFILLECREGEEDDFKAALFGSLTSGPGALEKASEGTVAIKNINAIPEDVQQSLYEVLKSKEYSPIGGGPTMSTNTRFVFTTDQDLGALTQSGNFNTSLFSRLGSLKVDIPPLAAHKDDILYLAYHVLRDKVPAEQPFPTIDRAAASVLLAYDWPGQVEELVTVFTDIAAQSPGDTITPANLPQAMVSSAPAASDEQPQAENHAAFYLKKYLAEKAAGK